jgi:hypothetical protein
VKIRISFRRQSSDLLSEKMMRNLAKRLKTHLKNGSIYFSLKPFPQKLNILRAITIERYDHGFVSFLGVYLLFYILEQMVMNLVNRLKTHLYNGSNYFPGELFPQTINILGEIIVERYDHRFVSVSGGYLSTYFLSKQ